MKLKSNMEKLNIAFDVDDTLIIPSCVTGERDTPNYPVIAVYQFFQAQGHNMYIWSGSGMEWATTWAEKLGLNPCTVIPKEKGTGMDMCFDDCDVLLAKVNVKVARVDNNVSRAEWNKTKRTAPSTEYLRGTLDGIIKAMGKTRTHYPTKEDVTEVIKAFNTEHGTDFKVD